MTPNNNDPLAGIEKILGQFIDDLKKQGLISGHAFTDNLPFREAKTRLTQVIRKQRADAIKSWKKANKIQDKEFSKMLVEARIDELKRAKRLFSDKNSRGFNRWSLGRIKRLNDEM